MSTPNLLDDDGRASMATALMMSHHAFRRDLGWLARALEAAAAGDARRAGALQEEWASFHTHLHGHHEAEDHGVFPGIAAGHPEVAATIARLSADHRRIDPLLELGDRAFARLRADDATTAARAADVVAALRALLDPHLAVEEAELIPYLRGARTFPPPATDDAAAEYAAGFAWAMHGIAPDVLARVEEMLPDNLRARLPAARADFAARWVRVWGTAAAGAGRAASPT